MEQNSLITYIFNCEDMKAMVETTWKSDTQKQSLYFSSMENLTKMKLQGNSRS